MSTVSNGSLIHSPFGVNDFPPAPTPSIIFNIFTILRLKPGAVGLSTCVCCGWVSSSSQFRSWERSGDEVTSHSLPHTPAPLLALFSHLQLDLKLYLEVGLAKSPSNCSSTHHSTGDPFTLPLSVFPAQIGTHVCTPLSHPASVWTKQLHLYQGILIPPPVRPTILLTLVRALTSRTLPRPAGITRVNKSGPPISGRGGGMS